VFRYSHGLGPRETALTETHVLSLSLEETQIIVQLQKAFCPTLCWTGDATTALEEKETESEDNRKLLRQELISKIDSFLRTLPGGERQRWFLKTNRHSCKDSPLDHPLQRDLSIFSAELDLHEVPIASDLDDIDFGPAFLAMCRSRLTSTAITNGEEVLSLLERSQRIHSDFNLQLRLCPSPWDCYLAFAPFDERMARYPLHEFRCYVSHRQVRCIMQYSYLATCPLPPEMMPHAIRAMVSHLNAHYLPGVPPALLDLAVDVQCIPVASPDGPTAAGLPAFEVRLIEVNPLGPGTVWGHLSWERDRPWLLFPPGTGGDPSLLPAQGCFSDTQGGERTVLWHSHESPVSADLSEGGQEQCLCVAMFTSRHPVGMVWGALAHIPPDYLLIVWEKWRLEELQQSQSQRAVQRASASSSGEGGREKASCVVA
jgi:hypothetical protein